VSLPFQPDPNTITWRLHLRAAPQIVYAMLATDAGRARFWAEEAVEHDGAIEFVFPAGQRWRGTILEREPPHRFAVVYYGGSTTTFTLNDDGTGGTDLTLMDVGVPAADRAEVVAGWVSVLLALKAAVDFDVDLRNHDLQRTWDTGYAEN
jgi:uncharacterized protein YndB with AHSA1/START domain